MESRKRPLVDEEDPIVTKKRILTGANGSPLVNGAPEQEENSFGEKLELYRKEAIYRRMKHYSKEHERSKVIIQQLERRKTTCEAGLAAISACWAQLVDTIRLVVKPNDLPEVNIQSDEIFNLTAHIQSEPSSQLVTALGETANATRALITKFVQIGEEKQSQLLQNQSFVECQRAQNECAVLRSEINILKSKLEDSETQKEHYHNALVVAENRFERSQSASVREMESRTPRNKGQESGPESKEEVQRPSPAPSPIAVGSPVHTNGIHDASEFDILREQIKLRDAKIVELEKETAILRERKSMMEVEFKAPSLEFISESPYYKILLGHASQLEATVNEKTEQINRLLEEVTQLQAIRTDMEEGLTNTSNQALSELKAMLAKRDSENVRLREQREQQGAELNERRQKDSIRSSSLQEYKLLVESNSERINILQSELSRCKAQLAAHANSEELMSFFLAGNIDQVRYFEAMREAKSQAEGRVAALEQTIEQYKIDQPDVVQHMKSEANALQQLSKLKAELDKYQRTYGTLSTLPPDVSELAKELRAKETELEKLRLLETQRKESESSLFVELEKLSALWEALDRQLKSKVFDLSSMEERLSKSAIEKAKSDNKYFAAMRDKEAIENERKNLVRTLERQGKAVDRLTDSEKHLRIQITVHDKEILALKKCCEALKDKLHRFEKENPELHLLIEGHKKRIHEMNLQLGERESHRVALREQLRIQEDDFMRAKKDMEKQIAQLKRDVKPDLSNVKSDPETLELKRLRSLATCTTCKETYRSTIITKCMHTFCKGCVDARLSTRQRKCPACSLPFGQSDVHTFFFQ
ncbi:E3 ubiquitin-protein ligase BRE1 [Psilocybe cubensis]|uniref:E3 ubiquitin-protein ligase BRE1 n=2 Tax=Psilocybe cubensis TaxID=181762 RepID=A0ACB8HBB1_PSICU|nr:E3 ubiquitin-protein ligase BRE1 [Psilocybe cubensis]KAH9485124.1 E3 ubiquitin-protein ligase BRE1 [Psilocybe cubensis]